MEYEQTADVPLGRNKAEMKTLNYQVVSFALVYPGSKSQLGMHKDYKLGISGPWIAPKQNLGSP